MSTKNADKTAAEREIVIERVFDAPRELVWAAWTDPKQVVKWWGPKGFTTTIEEMDVRPGGVWEHVMRGPDGTEYPNKSVFSEVVRPERIVFSHGGGKKGDKGVHFESTWTFETVDTSKTRVTIRMVFASAAEREMVAREYGAVEGGKQTLGRLAEHLEAMGKPAVGDAVGRKVVVKRVFEATAEQVFDAWLDPTAAARWLFATPKGQMVRVEIDARVGGCFTIVEKRGDTPVEHVGTYREMERPRRLVFDFSVPKYSTVVTRVTVEIAERGTGCELTLTHEGLLPEYRERTAEGWSTILGNLAAMMPSAPEFFISRVFDAPRELVWVAWTDPKKMARWWGPHDFTNPVCEMDVRAGGAYRIVMRSPAGEDYPLVGIFREVVQPERLVMTMDVTGHPDEWHRMVNPKWRKGDANPVGEMVQTVTFEKVEGKTRLTVRTRFESAAIRDAMVKMGMNEGWSQSLVRLDELLLNR
jgi:uncharacterized protein YndB with AHSA1/START domain